MIKKEIVTADSLRKIPIPISKAVKAGGFVFVSGTGGRDPKTGKWGTFPEQLKCSLDAIRVILQNAGSSLENVVSVVTYLKHREDFDHYNDIYQTYFPSEFPARATVVCEMVLEEMLIEISCVAIAPEK